MGHFLPRLLYSFPFYLKTILVIAKREILNIFRKEENLYFLNVLLSEGENERWVSATERLPQKRKVKRENKSGNHTLLAPNNLKNQL